MVESLEFTNRNRTIEDFMDSMAERKLTFYASDLIEVNGCRNLEELNTAIRRATEVCSNMRVSLKDNFKRIYRSDQGNLVEDWKLSPLAYCLILINSESSNLLVARMQLEMVKRLLGSDFQME